jgi:hypothetical protein
MKITISNDQSEVLAVIDVKPGTRPDVEDLDDENIYEDEVGSILAEVQVELKRIAKNKA